VEEEFSELRLYGVLSHKLWHKRTNKVARVVVRDVDRALMDTNYLRVEA
jgi:hypothetical protein